MDSLSKDVDLYVKEIILLQEAVTPIPLPHYLPSCCHGAKLLLKKIGKTIH